MKSIALDPGYHEYLTNIKLSACYLWMSSKGTEAQPMLYGDAVQNVQKVLQYTIPEKPFAESGPTMYEDDIERLQNVIGLLNILMTEYPEPFDGYKPSSFPDTLVGLAVELWGEAREDE